MHRKKVKIKDKFFSKIPGEYDKTCELLTDKINKRFPSKNAQKLLVFDSFDGSNHLETEKEKSDLMSFLSACTNKNLLSEFNHLTS